VCLYCNEHLEGDEAWLAHLKSEGHGAAEHRYGFHLGVSAALQSASVRKREPFIDIPPPNAGETWNE
jgi:hypothetical protein